MAATQHARQSGVVGGSSTEWAQRPRNRAGGPREGRAGGGGRRRPSGRELRRQVRAGSAASVGWYFAVSRWLCSRRVLRSSHGLPAQTGWVQIALGVDWAFHRGTEKIPRRTTAFRKLGRGVGQAYGSKAAELGCRERRANASTATHVGREKLIFLFPLCPLPPIATGPAQLPRYSDVAREEGWADRELIESLGECLGLVVDLRTETTEQGNTWEKGKGKKSLDGCWSFYREWRGALADLLLQGRSIFHSTETGCTDVETLARCWLGTLLLTSVGGLGFSHRATHLRRNPTNGTKMQKFPNPRNSSRE